MIHLGFTVDFGANLGPKIKIVKIWKNTPR